MTNTFLILVALSTIITTIVNFIKPWYKKFTWRFTISVNILLSLVFWLVASFSVAPLLELKLNIGLLIIIWLALWTWANIVYDIRELFKSATSRLKKDLE